MLEGHLDEVSYSHVAGWAANTSNANGIVQVSVFVDGKKIVQTECNQYREDLKEKGLGDGRHGFWYDFPEKLDESSNKKIVVRFADTGVALGNGEVLLSNGRTSLLPGFDEERASELMRLPAPVSQRALFDTFTMLNAEYGMYQLLRRLDLRGWTVRQAHYAAFGTIGNMQPGSYVESSSFVRDYLNDLLFSDEFQRSLIPSLLSAYAEKGRLLFVHIPKCAGSDLSKNLRTRYSSLDQRVMDPRWTGKEELFKQLREFVKLTRFSDTIFVHGHIDLNYYLENQLARPSDRLFSIVRDPMEIPVSTVNYVMTRIRQDFERQRLDWDTKEWFEFLGIDAMPRELSDEFAAEMFRRALYNQQIVVPDSMCHWLGGGDAQTVLERLAEHDVEITDTARYNKWLVERWGISSSTHQNESIKFFTLASLNLEDRDYLSEISREDLKLYAALQNGLTKSGRPWVVGRELLAR
jgi:hypothetical protein